MKIVILTLSILLNVNLSAKTLSPNDKSKLEELCKRENESTEKYEKMEAAGKSGSEMDKAFREQKKAEMDLVVFARKAYRFNGLDESQSRMKCRMEFKMK